MDKSFNAGIFVSLENMLLIKASQSGYYLQPSFYILVILVYLPSSNIHCGSYATLSVFVVHICKDQQKEFLSLSTGYADVDSTVSIMQKQLVWEKGQSGGGGVIAWVHINITCEGGL